MLEPKVLRTWLPGRAVALEQGIEPPRERNGTTRDPELRPSPVFLRCTDCTTCWAKLRDAALHFRAMKHCKNKVLWKG